MAMYAVKFSGSTPTPRQRELLQNAGITYQANSSAEGMGNPVHTLLVEASGPGEATKRVGDALGSQLDGIGQMHAESA